MVAVSMVAETSAVPEISADRGPVVLARLPRSKRRRRTPRLVEIPGIIALRKVAAVVIKVVAEAAIAAVRPLAVVVPVAAVLVVRVAVAVDRMATAEVTADSPSPRR
jgi:hypothetical protein